MMNSRVSRAVPWPGARQDVANPSPLMLHPSNVISRNLKTEDGELGQKDAEMMI